MDDRTRALVRLAASLTVDESVQVEAMDRAAELAPEQAEEVLLQSYLFMGFPVALNALHLWRRRTGRPAARVRAEPPAVWIERGEATCRAVYGPHYEALREVMGGIHPELDRWAVVEGYGKVLGRPELDLRTRELCIAAQLAGTDASRQLHSHLRGCLNVGNDVETVEATLTAVEDVIGGERVEAARRVWAKVRDRWIRKQGD
ncbi:MAG: carboxymuconolactone decarboxylase family protein [Longimicrobiales bacterium]|nr:carboxymuconolactone decarboxylase family protein [Longimicrobiales bacterium]